MSTTTDNQAGADTELTPSDDAAPEHTLQMWGGPLAALVPAVVLVGVLLWLSLAERAAISSFWVGGWAAVVVGLLLTKTPRELAGTIIRGLSNHTGAVIILAYLFAGVFGELLAKGGLVNGLLWFGVEPGVEGAFYAVLAFLLSCIFAAGTRSKRRCVDHPSGDVTLHAARQLDRPSSGHDSLGSRPRRRGIGIQLMGAHSGEAALLGVASVLEHERHA
ncbi:MAG: hypothetical protein ACR2FV_01915 [Ornithinimicrobium sp.]|uniref:hypothetical protein n=1 Tax=Ornithinimicrobium sp. TaxID=1977084 RepID=UPI003D9B88BC